MAGRPGRRMEVLLPVRMLPARQATTRTRSTAGWGMTSSMLWWAMMWLMAARVTTRSMAVRAAAQTSNRVVVGSGSPMSALQPTIRRPHRQLWVECRYSLGIAGRQQCGAYRTLMAECPECEGSGHWKTSPGRQPSASSRSRQAASEHSERPGRFGGIRLTVTSWPGTLANETRALRRQFPATGEWLTSWAFAGTTPPRSLAGRTQRLRCCR